MPDIFDLIKNWWKPMLAVVIVSVLVAGIITFLKPKEYLSVATAVPASSFTADKSMVFSENIQALYSSLGTADDLDLVIGTARLDTIYLAIAKQLNLAEHYNISEKAEGATLKAAACLRKKTKVMKSEYGELKVKAWDKNKEMAARLANATLQQLQQVHQHLHSISNEATLEGLRSGRDKLKQQSDSSSSNALVSRIEQYDKLIGEYQLMVDSKPPVLIAVENARPAVGPDRPRLKQVVVATALLSLIFSLLVALLLEKRKHANA